VTLRGLGPGGKDHAEAEVSTRSRVLYCSWWQVLVKVLRKLPGTGWALLDQCVVSAANFLTIYLFARYLGTSEFGIFALAHTGLLLLTSMQNALLVQPHNVLGAGLPQAEYRRFTSALLLAQVIFCVAVCVALGAAGLLVSGLGSSRAGSVLIALAVSAAPWMGPVYPWRIALSSDQRHHDLWTAATGSGCFGESLAGPSRVRPSGPGRLIACRSAIRPVAAAESSSARMERRVRWIYENMERGLGLRKMVDGAEHGHMVWCPGAFMGGRNAVGRGTTGPLSCDDSSCQRDESAFADSL
jgi:hypothetical protein